MTITMKNATSASAAFCEICEPQLALTVLIETPSWPFGT